MTDDPLRATITQRGILFASTSNEILIVQRATDGGWELPGGRLDRHETAPDGLQREIYEETALNPEIITPVYTLVWHNDDGEGRFGVYYYGRVDERAVTLSVEHDAHKWESPTAARARLSDPQQTAVDAAIETKEAHN